MESNGKLRIQHFSFSLIGNYTDKMLPDWNVIDEFGEEQRIGDEVDSTLIFDANIRYENKPHDYFIALNIFNLFNEEIKYPAAEDAPFQNGLIGRERTLMATIGRRF